MKALIRNDGETVTEDMDIPCIDWKTGAPLTNTDWFGGPYTLVHDYVPEDPTDDFTLADPAPAAASEASQDPAADLQDTIVIDGITYTRTSYGDKK